LRKVKNNIFLGLCISKHPSQLGDFAWQNIRGDRNLQRWILGEESRLRREYPRIWEFYQGWYITDIIKGDEVVDDLWKKSQMDKDIFQKSGFVIQNLSPEVMQKCLNYFRTEQEIFKPEIVIVFGGDAWSVSKKMLNIKPLQINFLNLPHRKIECFSENSTEFYSVRHYSMGNWINQLYQDLIGIYGIYRQPT